MGTDSENAKKIPLGSSDCISLEKTYATEKLCQALAPRKAFSRIKPAQIKPDGNYSIQEENVPLESFSLEQRIKENLPKEIPFTGNKGIKFQDVKKNPELLEKFVAQLNNEELATLVAVKSPRRCT